MNDLMFTELFGGADRYRALRCLFGNPAQTFGPRELASLAGIDPGNASRWLRRWADSGLLEKKVLQDRPRYKAAKDPALKPLQALFEQESELISQVRAGVESLGKRVKAAAIFGSIASGTASPASDIDLLLLTEMPRVQAQAAFKPLARKLGRPIDVLTYAPAEWEKALAASNTFASGILNGPKIILKGELSASAKA
jgi:predicted nucleotidyltransferase